MFLKQISPSNFGPFWGGQINIEPEVTVITGANDVGKSSLLRLLQIICSRTANNGLSGSDVNCDRSNGLSVKWDDDPEIRATATFYYPTERETEATVQYYLAPKHWTSSTAKAPNYSGPLHGKLDILPTPVHIDMGRGPQIREKLQLDSLNSDERNLLSIGFGNGFKADVLESANESSYHRIIANAEKKLNEKLSQLLPPTLAFEFHLRTNANERKSLFITVSDRNGGVTELNRRGKGVQVFISLLGHLAEQNYQGGDVLLLIDEPETHLHADAQHAFRDSLEKLASTNRFQVVYATHSPSMVNTMRPHSLRLITRTSKNDRAYSVLENTPFGGGGFLSVRASLGISPADSLLFAPITIVVEGKTEIICLPILFKRLAEEQSTEFQILLSLLAQTILIDGEGCGNVGNLCRIAKGNGAEVIAFSDDDQSRRWRQQLEKESKDTPLILSRKGGEFEEVVPISRYFEALGHYYLDFEKPVQLNVEEYTQWIESKPEIKKRSFTNLVSAWLETFPDMRMPAKAHVMRYAIERTPLAEIDLNGIRNLITAMKQVLGD